MKRLIKSIKIGKISLKNNLSLAPMEGFTNIAFRKNVLKYNNFNIGLMFTEMIPANALSRDSNYTKHLTLKYEKEILAYQLFGNKVEAFVKSVEKIENYADLININLGCPVEKIISQGAGCGLLKRKNRVYDIIKNIRKITNKPITIKIRTGYIKETHFDYDKLYELGCDAVFIHARTCKQKYSGKININYLKEAKEKSPIPIIANGSIETYNNIQYIHNYTNIDGYMIGRAALHNPKVFTDLANEKNINKWATSMKIKEKISFLKDYYKDAKEYNLKNPFIKTKSLSLFLFRYTKNAKELREKIIKTKDIYELFDLLDFYR